MGRTSLAGERIEQILDAYTRVVARSGLAGATLDRVAQESGFTRGHVRHYVGNRDGLQELFRQRLVRRYTERAREVVDAADEGQRTAALLSYMFGAEMGPSDDDAAIDAVMAAARFDTELRADVRTGYLGQQSTISEALARDFPGSRPTVYREAAYQLLALAYGHWSLQALGFPKARADGAERLALEIVESVAAVSRTSAR